jgi:hypothetical protein
MSGVWEREQDPSADHDPVEDYYRWCDNQREWENEMLAEEEAEREARAARGDVLIRERMEFD